MKIAFGLLVLQILLECIIILVIRSVFGMDILYGGHTKTQFLELISITLIGYGYHRVLATGLVQLVLLNIRNTYTNNPMKYLRQNCVISASLVFLFSLFFNQTPTIIGLTSSALLASLVILWIVPKLKSR